VQQLPNDSLHAVLDSVFAAPAYAWASDTHPLVAVRDWWQRLADWLANARTLHPLLFQWLLLGLVAVLVVIVVHAAYVFQQTLRRAARREGSVAASLPVSRRDVGWYLRAADEAASAGRYREALRLAFDALVVRLDAIGSIRWAPGKTAREYTREAQLVAGERDRLRQLVGILYRHVYSGAPCGPSEFAVLRDAASSEWHAATG
jgi:Domain of unknown function (DUF4129)